MNYEIYKGTKDYGLWYKKGEIFKLKSFTDVDWVGSIDDRKRTSGGAFFLGQVRSRIASLSLQ